MELVDRRSIAPVRIWGDGSCPPPNPSLVLTEHKGCAFAVALKDSTHVHPRGVVCSLSQQYQTRQV